MVPDAWTIGNGSVGRGNSDEYSQTVDNSALLFCHARVHGMIAISVSLYDKFDDLGVLLDIIRNNWDDDYFVSVCSNHPDAESKINQLDANVDVLEQGAQIRYDPNEESRGNNANFYYRVINTIKTAIQNAFASDNVDYVCHVHADAWPLSEPKLRNLVKSMDERDASVAFKAWTKRFLDTYPPGTVMDQFMIFDSAKCVPAGVFDQHITEMPPPVSPHRYLPMRFISQLGWSELYHYSNRETEIFWDGVPTVFGTNSVRPMMYNQRHEQIHIATEDFPDDLGKSLQAHYLSQNELDQGHHISELIDKHLIDEDYLFSRLDEHFSKKTKQLRWYYGLSSDSMGRNTKKMNKYTNITKSQKIKNVLKHNTEELARTGYDVFQQLTADSSDGNHQDNIHTTNLNEYYDKYLNEEDFPESFSHLSIK